MPPLGTEARAELARDARADRPRALHRSGDRAPARPARAARGVAALRLRRREPDPRHPPRLGEGAPRAHRAPRRDDARGRERPPRLGRGARERRLRLVPPLPAHERRAQAPLHRVLRAGRPRRTRRSSTTTSRG